MEAEWTSEDLRGLLGPGEEAVIAAKDYMGRWRATGRTRVSGRTKHSIRTVCGRQWYSSTGKQIGRAHRSDTLFHPESGEARDAMRDTETLFGTTYVDFR